jgi:hypothetical protein
MWPRDDRWSICVDFDDTITSYDTIGALAQLACTNYPSRIVLWEQLTQSYSRELRVLMQAVVSPTSIPDRSIYDPSGLEAFLNDFSQVDAASIERVIASNVLAGLSKPEIQLLAKTIPLKPDCIDILRAWNNDVIVVSSNWSKDLICETLLPLKAQIRIVSNGT